MQHSARGKKPTAASAAALKRKLNQLETRVAGLEALVRTVANSVVKHPMLDGGGDSSGDGGSEGGGDSEGDGGSEGGGDGGDGGGSEGGGDGGDGGGGDGGGS